MFKEKTAHNSAYKRFVDNPVCYRPALIQSMTRLNLSVCFQSGWLNKTSCLLQNVGKITGHPL